MVKDHSGYLITHHNTHIFDKIIFFKYSIRQINSTKTNRNALLILIETEAKQKSLLNNQLRYHLIYKAKKYIVQIS